MEANNKYSRNTLLLGPQNISLRCEKQFQNSLSSFLPHKSTAFVNSALDQSISTTMLTKIRLNIKLFFFNVFFQKNLYNPSLLIITFWVSPVPGAPIKYTILVFTVPELQG